MIWLTGAGGMLGRQMARELEKASLPFIPTDCELDISEMDRLREFAGGKRFGWIINCAAYTAVDRAEMECEQAFRVNGAGVENLGRIAKENGTKIVHFSSDYVFDGKAGRAYHEEDEPCPVSVYGQSKLDGERRLQRETQSFFILRISWLYGSFGQNFVGTMLRLFLEKKEVRVVNDQVGSPTYTGELAGNVVRRLIGADADRFGIYHYSDDGEISWYDFAAEIQSQALRRGLIRENVRLLAIPTRDFPTAAVRPACSLLDKRKVKADLGFAVYDWRMNLEKYFREITEPW